MCDSKKNVVSESVPAVGENCEVKWSDGEVLTATLLAAGNLGKTRDGQCCLHVSDTLQTVLGHTHTCTCVYVHVCMYNVHTGTCISGRPYGSMS